MKIGIISGYFNPLHAGHVEYINAAKKECDKLIAIINSDHQRMLKGSKEFMDQYHRSFIVENLKSVDETFISIDDDKTQCKTLRYFRELYPEDEILFMNSGDRKGDNLVCAENNACKELKILAIVLDLPKIYSSSELLKKL
jgi:cytidyltransferase-like protein